MVEGETAAMARAGPLTATLSVGDVPSWTLLPSMLFFGREATAVVANPDGLATSLLARSIPYDDVLTKLLMLALVPFTGN